MIIANSIYTNMFNSVAREFVGRVELLEGSTLISVFEHDGALQSFTIEKTGDKSKFFGYGICQKATVKLQDRERTIDITKGQVLQIAHGLGKDYLYTYPAFYVEEVVRDENTNGLTITAYDMLYKASSHQVKELKLPDTYTLKMFAAACAGILGMPIAFNNIPNSFLTLEYTKENANFSGEETIREALDDLAEIWGSIYYFSNDWELTFQSFDQSGDPVLAIDKSKYFELTVKTAHTLQNVASITELGDNVVSSSGTEGETAYLRENAFLTLRDDIATLLDNLCETVAGLTIYQFNCKHRGDFRMEIGDKISLTTKDDNTINTYVLDDSITYNGGLSGATKWEYSASEAVDAAPTTLGEVLQQTSAKVDKVNQEIEFIVSRVEEGKDYTDEKFAEVTITYDKIVSRVNSVNTKLNDTRTELESTITQTADAINLEVFSLEQKLNGTKTELKSSISQTASSIRSEVSDVRTDLNGVETELRSSIEQTATSIRSEVNNVSAELQSSIEQTASDINLRVDKMGQTMAEIRLDVDGIDLTGLVTIADLAGNGTTTINGSNITTGTINADRINMTGAINWGDLSSSCKNTIASYAGADVELPDYIKSTYIDEARIVSPTIQGGTLSAGTTADGYMTLSSTGLNFHSSSKPICGIGYYSGNKELPYILLGAGVDSGATDQGMIKKYTNGIWIGDSDSINSSSPSAYSVGIFIDFTNGKLYRYNGSGTRAELV